MTGHNRLARRFSILLQQEPQVCMFSISPCSAHLTELLSAAIDQLNTPDLTNEVNFNHTFLDQVDMEIFFAEGPHGMMENLFRNQ